MFFQWSRIFVELFVVILCRTITVFVAVVQTRDMGLSSQRDGNVSWWRLASVLSSISSTLTAQNFSTAYYLLSLSIRNRVDKALFPFQKWALSLCLRHSGWIVRSNPYAWLASPSWLPPAADFCPVRQYVCMPVCLSLLTRFGQFLNISHVVSCVFNQ
jgi:hypothetical protein